MYLLLYLLLYKYNTISEYLGDILWRLITSDYFASQQSYLKLQ